MANHSSRTSAPPNLLRLPFCASVPYTGFACDTSRDWFGSQEPQRRTAAPRRYFYVRTLLCAFFGRAIAGRAQALPVSFVAGLPTLLSARPPHLEVGSGFTAHKGGHHG